MLATLQGVWRDVGLREIGHRIVARFEEQENVSLSAIQVPPKRTRMRRRSGSAYNSLFGSGSGTRNRLIAPGESGPCCHDSPIILLGELKEQQGTLSPGAIG